MSNWYLIHTKIRQERVALENLERQGFECFLPLIRVEKLRRSALVVVEEPLFPRYLFIRLASGTDAPSWSPIRSTIGVSRLFTFGQTPAKIDDGLMAELRTHSANTDVQLRHFAPGETVTVTDGPFVGLEAIYQSKPVQLSIEPTGIKKLSGRCSARHGETKSRSNLS